MRNRTMLFLMISLLMAVGCQQTDRLLDQNEVFDNQIWEQDRLVTFEVEIADTVNSFDFNLNLRNSMNYPFRNLYFLYSIKDQNGNLVLSNQEQLMLFSKSGKPLGASSGILGIDFGDEYYSSNKFLTHQFKKAGKYTVSVSQNMRGQQELNGVMLVGVKISPSNK